MRRREPITEVLVNYRRDGTAFWNQVSISPVFDGSGQLVSFVGVQNDVTERVLVEQERSAAPARIAPAGSGTPRRRCGAAPGGIPVLYTDGFTDVVGEDADERTALLEGTVAGLAPGSAAEEVVEQVGPARACPVKLSDDVALLTVRLDG